MSSQLLLGTPITFPRCGKTAPTRTLKSAMTERLCTYDQDNLDERGKPTEEYRRLYEVWGEGQIGVIVLGNIPVDRKGLEAKGNAIIDVKSSWDPVAAFKPVIAAAKAHGSLVIGQLTHGGRQVSTDVDPHPVSSSDVQCPPAMRMEFGKPRPLTVGEIDGLFLSARVNTRTDSYGGSLANRARIILRIVDAIKARVPRDFLLSIKINSADFSEGGMTPEESRQVCEWLDERGVDLIELSGGTYESGLAQRPKKESTIKREAYFTEFSAAIKPHVKNALICVTGGFRTQAGMEDALQKRETDLVGLARPLTAEPHLVREMLEGKKEAAKENVVDPSLHIPVCVAQIGAIARGLPIPDLSDPEEAEACLAAALRGKA
ncbi:hypothetical protein JCM6882_005652 [Rhodosporidiobolus microsporus]